MTEKTERVPDRNLPLAYLTLAHLSLLVATLVLAGDPRSLAGFFYHPRMIAVVHLVTLGWITGTILGMLYVVLPLALRSPLPARRPDHWAFWAFAVGEAGMVSHFWLASPAGMVWSAGLVVAALGWVGWRVLGALRRAPIPLEHRLPFLLSFANLILAGALGMLIGVDRSTDVVPGFVLAHVAAHAHLAALGWAMLMILGAGYRLLPMVLPAAMPTGGSVLATVVVTEAGVLALAAALFTGSALTPLAALVLVAGVGLFFGHLTWMRRRPKPPPRDLPRPDLGRAHIGLSFLYLLLAIGLGAAVLLWPRSPHRVALLTAYGATLLVGFLSQIIVGFSVRLLPLFTWMRDFAAGGFDRVPVSPHRRIARSLHRLGFWCWTAGTPLLITGLATGRGPLVRPAGALLALATVSSLLQIGWQLRQRPPDEGPGDTA